VVLLGAGLLFATSAETAGGTSLRSERGDLPGLIEAESARAQARQARVSGLRESLDQGTRAAARGSAEVQALQEQADALTGPAGLEPVRGPALIVALDDAPRDTPKAAGARPDDLVVHQQDVQAVVNALWAGGAEAMMLQDQRVISTSAVRCVGNTLILQGRVYSPPYVITAVGNVAGMQRAIAASAQIDLYRQYVEALGLGWSVSEQSEAILPAYAGSLTLEYARVPSREAAAGEEGAA
jgi:uncharacterized protein YlxW (UPF0749 family)